MTIRPGSMPISRISSLSAPASSLLTKTHRRSLTWRSLILQTRALLVQGNTRSDSTYNLLGSRSLAQIRPEPISELWFTASFPAKAPRKGTDTALKDVTQPNPTGPAGDHKPPDERTLKLGKTLRTLSPLLPNIFVSQLPTELLNPGVTLHLFPSTHPHLPVVKSRMPCHAALWTAPVAWGSLPIVGNVKVKIMSEKMVRTGFVSAPAKADNDCDGFGEEKLVVRWKTERKVNGKSNDSGSPQSLSSSSNEINRGLSTLLGGSQPIFSKEPSEPFTGIFIFSFDQEGKIGSITIEHADENNGFDKTSRVVTLADWLLGKARWGRVEGGFVPGLAYKEAWCRNHSSDKTMWRKRH